jgi:hypothetical protein
MKMSEAMPAVREWIAKHRPDLTVESSHAYAVRLLLNGEFVATVEMWADFDRRMAAREQGAAA